jgi:hypothetical protein
MFNFDIRERSIRQKGLFLLWERVCRSLYRVRCVCYIRRREYIPEFDNASGQNRNRGFILRAVHRGDIPPGFQNIDFHQSFRVNNPIFPYPCGKVLLELYQLVMVFIGG